MSNTGHQTLGDNFIPINYSLTFEPDMKKFKFRGSATIKGNIKKRTRLIKLNAKELEIKSVSVADGLGIQKASFKVDKEKQTVEIKVKRPVIAYVEVDIDYYGMNNDRLYGFYRSRYDFNGKQGHILTSQFEAPNARDAFPCVDEPAFKATFDVSFVVDKDLDCISNMPVSSTKPKGKKKLVVFGTTPKMSTYLLYLGVGKYDYLNAKAGKIALRVITTPGKKRLGNIALDFGRRLLDVQQKYFGIDYPIPKLDLLGIPDFSAGAMENWGAITFRETALLGDEKCTAVSVKQRIAEVISHELVHQWFGDLVTMKWWNDIWLNESFADFMAYKMVDKIMPEWDFMLRYYIDTVADAFSIDSLKTTHPIHMEVNTPGEIGAIFDMISYHKGGSMLYMLEDYVGDKIFRKGLGIYLKENQYGNASSEDLWMAVQNAAKREGLDTPVSGVIKKWVEQAGYPVVSVKKSGKGKFILEQKRFTILDSDYNETWPIPIRYISAAGEGRVLMDKKRMVLSLKSDWLKVNYTQSGFYRAVYDGAELEKLGAMVRDRDKRFTEKDAWGVENDLFARARSGRISAKRYLDFVNKYLMGSGYPTSSSISGHLGFLIRMGEGLPFGDQAKRVSVKFHGKILNRLGWHVRDGESSIDTSMRNSAIAGLAFADDKHTIDRSVSMFNHFVEGNGELNTNLRAAIYSIVAMNKPSEGLMKRFMKMYKDQELPEEKIKALQSVGLLDDERLLKRALDMSIGDPVRLQDSIIIISNASGNRQAKKVMLDWITRNWQRLMKIYDPGAHNLDHALGALSIYTDKKSRERIAAFFSKKENMRDDIKREFQQTLERIDANIAFMERNRWSVN